jgi:hypothetical protein
MGRPEAQHSNGQLPGTSFSEAEWKGMIDMSHGLSPTIAVHFPQYDRQQSQRIWHPGVERARRPSCQGARGDLQGQEAVTDGPTSRMVGTAQGRECETWVCQCSPVPPFAFAFAFACALTHSPTHPLTVIGFPWPRVQTLPVIQRGMRFPRQNGWLSWCTHSRMWRIVDAKLVPSPVEGSIAHVNGRGIFQVR